MPAILFDIDDTLYDRGIPFQNACRSVLNAAGGLDSRTLFFAFLKHGNDVFEASMNGSMSMEEMYIYRIRHALADYGLALSDEDALDFQKQYEWEQHHIQPDPGMKAALDWCTEQSFFLGIITNGKTDHQRMKYRAMQLETWIPPEHLLASGDIGINKPDIRIFQLAAQRWELDPDQTWYIGDSYPHDIVSAKRAGWHTIWLDKTCLPSSDDIRPADNAWPDAEHRITSSSELTELLKTIFR
jgi:putative hydrolase of the HAD superfamily